MSPWAFVAGAYAVAVGGTAALVVASLVAMRKAERQGDALTRR